MKYSLSYPNRLRLTANDRRAVENGITSIRRGNRDGSSVNSVGLQYGRTKYSICRSPELKAADGGECFTMTLQRGDSQYDVGIIANA